jgi:putative RNA 2'-phosphotransferase
MTREQLTSLSKFLSFVLRHEPEAIELRLDPQGWAEIEELLARCQAHGKALSRPILEEIVATSPKRRFAISDDGRRIRANQGHSIDVDLGYAPAQPPEVLFHGTIAAALPSIRAEGLRKMQRHHVHLSPDEETARIVAQRRGKPAILRIAAALMHGAGHVFYLSTNGVWLTDAVPPQYLEIPED